MKTISVTANFRVGRNYFPITSTLKRSSLFGYSKHDFISVLNKLESTLEKELVHMSLYTENSDIRNAYKKAEKDPIEKKMITLKFAEHSYRHGYVNVELLSPLFLKDRNLQRKIALVGDVQITIA